MKLLAIGDVLKIHILLISNNKKMRVGTKRKERPLFPYYEAKLIIHVPTFIFTETTPMKFRHLILMAIIQSIITFFQDFPFITDQMLVTFIPLAVGSDGIEIDAMKLTGKLLPEGMIR